MESWEMRAVSSVSWVGDAVLVYGGGGAVLLEAFDVSTGSDGLSDCGSGRRCGSVVIGADPGSFSMLRLDFRVRLISFALSRRSRRAGLRARLNSRIYLNISTVLVHICKMAYDQADLILSPLGHWLRRHRRI